jgi:tetratricopeptide (TPR) repeat protein
VAAACLEPGYRVARHAALCGLGSSRDDASFTLYTIGESTPAGEPFDEDISAPHVVSRLFDDRIGGRPVRVVNLAAHGESIYPQSMALERALECRSSTAPAAVLVYSGNNEEGTRFDLPVVEMLKEEVFDRSTALRDLIFAIARARPSGTTRTFATYEYHLRRAVAMSLARGVVPILSTVASNDSGIDPPLFPEQGLPSREAIVGDLAIGRALEKSRKSRDALEYYRTLSADHPELGPYLRYRRAQCLLAVGRYRAAGLLFHACRNGASGDNFHRATDLQNELVRRIARDAGVPLSDAVAAMESASPHGIIGDELMADGHHPNIAGHLLIDESFARALSERFREPIRRRYAGGAALFADFSYDDERRSASFLDSGNWWFSVSGRHLAPQLRLDHAHSCFAEALRLDPESFGARLGLAVVEGARHGLLDDPESVSILEKTHIFYVRGPKHIGDLNRLLAALHKAGVSDSELDDIRRHERRKKSDA